MFISKQRVKSIGKQPVWVKHKELVKVSVIVEPATKASCVLMDIMFSEGMHRSL